MTGAPRTRIKICGITRPEDALAVAMAGADALGLNFAAISPRRIAPTAAAEIAQAVDGQLLRVGLFVDPEQAEVETILERVPLDVLQFHGTEPAMFCTRFGLPYLKAHRVSGPVDPDALTAAHPDACAHLLDTYVAGRPGGTGRTFDWAFWPRRSRAKLVLAGGLTPANVRTAIAATRPYAVDVSGGVEGPCKGEKDMELVRAFVAAVRAADAELTSRSSGRGE